MSDEEERHVFEVGQRVALFGAILQEGAGGHEWFVRFDSDGSYPPEMWVDSEALFHDRRPAQPTDTVLELNKQDQAIEAGARVLAEHKGRPNITDGDRRLARDVINAALRNPPTVTVLELNKRITALHQRLERIRICVIEWEHGNQASAVMPRIRHELDQENP